MTIDVVYNADNWAMHRIDPKTKRSIQRKVNGRWMTVAKYDTEQDARAALFALARKAAHDDR
jgi:hypothetical protein